MKKQPPPGLQNSSRKDIARRLIPVVVLACLVLGALLWVNYGNRPESPAAVDQPPTTLEENLIAQAPPQTADPNTDKESILDLQLAAITRSENKEYAKATLWDIQTERFDTLKIDDELPLYKGVKLLEIHDRHVVMADNGRQFELWLDQGAPVKRRAMTEEDYTNTIAQLKESARIGQMDESIWNFLQKRTGQRDDAALGMQGRFHPYWGERDPVTKKLSPNMLGLKVKSFWKNSFWDQIGLQEGDIIKTVNGLDVTSTRPQDIYDLYYEEKSLELEVERGETVIQLQSELLPPG